MPYSTILVSTSGHITTVTLNRPDRLNALSLELADELHDTLHTADQDDGTRVVVLTGAGRAFSAGADLKAAGQEAAALRPSLSADAESQVRFENLAIARLSNTADAAEARAAFREKREPV